MVGPAGEDNGNAVVATTCIEYASCFLLYLGGIFLLCFLCLYKGFVGCIAAYAQVKQVVDALTCQ